ncbi:MAG: hypothetical protein ACKV2T_08445 [Kofleriaceae bacterium]
MMDDHRTAVVRGFMLAFGLLLGLGCEAERDAYQDALEGMASSDPRRKDRATYKFVEIRFNKGGDYPHWKLPPIGSGPLPPHPEDARVRQLMAERIKGRYRDPVAVKVLALLRSPHTEPELIRCAIDERGGNFKCLEALAVTAFPADLSEVSRHLDESLATQFALAFRGHALPHLQEIAAFERAPRCRWAIGGLTILRVQERELYAPSVVATAAALRNRDAACRTYAVEVIGQHIGYQHLLIPALLDPSDEVARVAREIVDGTRPPTRTIDTPYD